MTPEKWAKISRLLVDHTMFKNLYKKKKIPLVTGVNGNFRFSGDCVNSPLKAGKFLSAPVTREIFIILHIRIGFSPVQEYNNLTQASGKMQEIWVEGNC